MRLPKLEKDYRFCLFIDALDELQEIDQKTWQDLIDMLESWTMTTSNAIKICASSREENVFYDKFLGDAASALTRPHSR
jgi:hypothetical protein